MSKGMQIMWVLIIVGTIFIAMQLSKPESGTDEDFEENKISEEVIFNNASPKTFNEYLQEAENAMSNDDPVSAIKNLKYAFSINSKSSEVLFKLGEAYLANNEPKMAMQTFKELEKQNPSTKVKLAQAQAHFNLREIDQAKAIIWQLDQEDPEVKFYTAITLILYKDFEGAKNKFTFLAQSEATINQVIKKKSQKFVDVYNLYSYYKESEVQFLQTMLAKTLTDIGQYEITIPLLFDVINSKGNYRDAWIVLGYAYLNTGKAVDAIDAFSKAKSLDSEKPETLFFLGLAYAQDNKYDQAINMLEKAEKAGFEPKEQIDLKLAEIYTIVEDFKNAEEKYSDLITAGTKNPEIFVRAVWLNIEKIDDADKAIRVAKKTLDFHPEDPMSYNLVGWALTANERYEDGKKFLNYAIKLDPNFAAAYLNLGWLYEQSKEEQKAKAFYKKAYLLGGKTSIAELAAARFNSISEQEVQNYYMQTNITSPNQ